MIGVHVSPQHTFTKQSQAAIELIAGQGVRGDVHASATVRQNLRQVHVLAGELIEELRGEGFNVEGGSMGENITTKGVHLTSLPHGTILIFASGAAVQLTGIRTPCKQLNGFQEGLLAAICEKNEQDEFRRPAGVMGVVITGGLVTPNDEMSVRLPTEPHRPMDFI